MNSGACLELLKTLSCISVTSKQHISCHTHIKRKRHHKGNTATFLEIHLCRLHSVTKEPDVSAKIAPKPDIKSST